MAHKPWRSKTAEGLLVGEAPSQSAFLAAAHALLEGAQGQGANDFKIGLARRAIDAEFARQTLARCGGPLDLGCRLTASVYIGAVEFNSWRQGYGVPRSESMTELLGPLAAGALVGGGLWLLLLSPRRPSRPRLLVPVGVL